MGCFASKLARKLPGNRLEKALKDLDLGFLSIKPLSIKNDSPKTGEIDDVICVIKMNTINSTSPSIPNPERH